MTLLYIHQYFVTPEEHGTSRSYWFAKKLIEKGIKVTMITSTNEYKHRLPGRCNIDGIDVIYLKNEYSQYFSKVRKIKSFIGFLYCATKQALKERNVDLIYATSTPLTIGAVALFIHKIKGWKYIFEVRDLWPEFPIQVGAIRNKCLIEALRKLEALIYHHAEHIVALSPGMADGVLKCKIPETKVTVIPNMSKVDIFYPHERIYTQFDKYGIDKSKFNVAHVGSMGVANGLMTVMESARYLQDILKNGYINFIMVGDGATKPMLEQFVRDNELLNVRFIGEYGTSDVAEILNCCDVSLTSFKNLPILYTNSPNKLFDSLSAGKPIVVNSAGWTKDLVEKHCCGFYANPNNPSDLANKLVDLSKDSAALKRYSVNSRKIAEEVFDKSILTENFYQVVSKYIG